MYQPYAVNVPPPVRPKILCLHGGGSSGMIFQIQLVRLSRVLEPRFEFVFLEGPIECDAGPGVLPVFEGCGPYRRWVSDDPSTPADEFARQKETAMELLKVYVQQTGPYVGVLGFSQGARAAASLLLEHQRRPFVPYDMFGVFLCGTYPLFVEQETGGGGQGDGDDKIRAPTFHLVGLFDPWKPASEALIESCAEGSTRKVLRYPGGHHLPNAPEAIQNIATMVMDLCKETTGARV